MDIEEAAHNAIDVFQNYNEALKVFLEKHPCQKRVFDNVWIDLEEEGLLDEY